MHRVLVPPESVSGESITIVNPQSLHYLLDVLRIRCGDKLECFDGKSNAYVGAVTQSSREKLTIAIDQRIIERSPSIKITLAHALIKPERFEWMVQKATELGIWRIVPFISARTTLQRLASFNSNRLKRWVRIAEEASRQCARATVPLIEEPRSFDALLAECKSDSLLFTLGKGSLPFAKCLERLKAHSSVTIFIGPEGDFSPQELAMARRYGVNLAALGRLVLRSETAAIAVLAVIQQSVGQL